MRNNSPDLKLASLHRVISPRKPDYVPSDFVHPSRFTRKKTYRGPTAPESNKNFKSMPKNF